MNKFHGYVGYLTTIEDEETGIWSEDYTEKEVIGDFYEDSYNYRYENANQLNDNLSIHGRVSILADPYAIENYSAIRYVRFEGATWKVTNVTRKFPRLILSIGGLYNGE